MEWKFFLAVAVLLGTMIGAGIFALPYVVARSGILPSFFYFLFLGGIICLIHLFFGEVVLRTKENHRLAGYAKKYLGKQGRILATFSVILGQVLVLLIYIILAGKFLRIFFSNIPFIDFSYFSILFSLFLAPFLFGGIKVIAKTEVLTNISFIFILFLIFLFNLPRINFGNFEIVNYQNLLLPYGVIFFALIGWNAVPEMAEVLKERKERKYFKLAILTSIIFAIFLYLFFSIAVVGVSGKYTSSEVFSGLSPFWDRKILLFGALAGVITIADSYLILGLYFKNSLIYDFKVKKFLAFLIAWGIPLMLFLFGAYQFVKIIAFTGTLIGTIEGTLIIFLWRKAKILGDRKPEYSLEMPQFLFYFLMVVIILGGIFHLFFEYL